MPLFGSQGDRAMTLQALLGWAMVAIGGLTAISAVNHRPRWRWFDRGQARLETADLVARIVGILSWRERARTREAWEEGFREGVEHLLRMVESGSSLSGALDDVAKNTDPFSRQLAYVLSMVRSGSPLGDALASWPGRVDADLMSRLISILRASHQTGADLSRPLNTLVEQCLTRQDIRQRVKSQTAEARLTARLLLLLPPAIVLYFVLGQADTATWLFGTGPGRLTLLYSLGSWAVGGWLIERTIKGVGGPHLGSSWRELK